MKDYIVLAACLFAVVSPLIFLGQNYSLVKKTGPSLQKQLEATPVKDLGPLVFMESYNFHDKDLQYKVVRLETGERIFIAFSGGQIACTKLDKR